MNVVSMFLENMHYTPERLRILLTIVNVFTILWLIERKELYKKEKPESSLSEPG